MSDLVKDAEAYVKAHKADDVHPDVAARMAGFTRAQEKRTGAAVQAEAKALLDAVRSLGDDNQPATEDNSEVRRPRPAKKAPAAKKAAAKKAPGRKA